MGERVDARVDLARALAAQLGPALLAPGARWRRSDLGAIGRLGGFDVHASISAQGLDPVAVVSFPDCPIAPVDYTIGDVTTDVGAGLVVRLENTLHGLDQRLTDVRAGIVTATEERDRAAVRADAPFPKGEQLSAARARRDDVNARMAAARETATAPPGIPEHGGGGVGEATAAEVAPAAVVELDPELVAMRAAAAASFTRLVHPRRGGPDRYRTPRPSTEGPALGQGHRPWVRAVAAATVGVVGVTGGGRRVLRGGSVCGRGRSRGGGGCTGR